MLSGCRFSSWSGCAASFRPTSSPYTFGDNWFFDAELADQQRLERKAVEALAALHALTVEGPAAFLAGPDDGASPLRHHVQEMRGYYDWVAADGVSSPLIERGFRWLEEHWPSNEDDAVFSWGDARIGNMMFEDFEPVAVLDWEMASVGTAGDRPGLDDLHPSVLPGSR